MRLRVHFTLAAKKIDIPLSTQLDLLIEYNVGEYPRSAEDHRALAALAEEGLFDFYKSGMFETTPKGRWRLRCLYPLMHPSKN
jgi:hypothetical protein